MVITDVIRNGILKGAEKHNFSYERDKAATQSFLNMANIGDYCEAKTWYNYRNCDKPITQDWHRLIHCESVNKKRILDELKLGIDDMPKNISIIEPLFKCYDFNFRLVGDIDAIVKQNNEHYLIQIRTSFVRSNFLLENDFHFFKCDEDYYRWEDLLKTSDITAAQLKLGYLQKVYSPIKEAILITENITSQELWIRAESFKPNLFEAARAKAWKIINSKKPLEETKNDLCMYCRYQTCCENGSAISWTSTKCLDCKFFRSWASFPARYKQLRQYLKSFKEELIKAVSTIIFLTPIYSEALKNVNLNTIVGEDITKKVINYEPMGKEDWCALSKNPHKLNSLAGCQSWEKI
jgi:hypothetical protein